MTSQPAALYLCSTRAWCNRNMHGKYEHLLEPVWRILEPYFSLKLVNPYFIKRLPGKKSDVKDAEWIACVLDL